MTRETIHVASISGKGSSNQRSEAWRQLRQLCYGRERSKGEPLATATGIKLRSTREIAAAQSAIIKDAYRGNNRVAATTLLVPPELCWASGFLPLNLEMLTSMLASNSAITELVNRGSGSTPRCSFFDAMRGAYLAELLPQPDLVLSSSAYCEGIGLQVEELAFHFRQPHIHIDIPMYRGGNASAHLAKELGEVFHHLCALNSVPIRQGERRLRRVMQHSSSAKRVYSEVAALRRDHPDLDLSLEPLLWHFSFFQNWGTEAGTRLCTALRDEIVLQIKRQSNQGSRRHGLAVGVFSIFPYGRTGLWRSLIDAGAYSVFEGLNWLGPKQKQLEPDVIPDLEIDALYANLAENLVQAPMRGGEIRRQSLKYMQTVKEAGAKGLIIFSHDQCQMLWPRLHELEEAASETRLPVCVIDGDCIVGIPLGPANLRLKSFLVSLQASAAAHPPVLNREAEDSYPDSSQTKYLVGVDLGSWYSKLVVLDHELNIIKQNLLRSGISYPTLLQRIVEQLDLGDDYCIAVAGIGGDSSSLRLQGGQVLRQTTEISALATAVRSFYTEDQEITVIDIGSQDIKVLHFDRVAAEPICHTNRSCGAGTGCVLAQILERWQQSEPDMTFECLDNLALEATGSESINTTCGIFAVSTVVSAVVQADKEHRKSILRGVYQYIVTQVVRQLPMQLRGGARIMLVGGLANHRTLQQCFTESGFELQPFPVEIDPQYIVALGTALMAACTDGN